MARGFLSEGRGRSGDGDDDASVALELGWTTEKAWGFRDPFRKNKTASLVGGSREQLIWVPKAIKGEPLEWDADRGRLTGPRWLLKEKGLI